MNYFPQLSICYALNLPINPVAIKDAHKQIPKSTFGVFVSIERSIHQKLQTWPFNNHGCIGYYNTSYTPMAPDDIIHNMFQVSKSATFEDSRNEYFLPIFDDSFAKYIVYLMQLPVIPIDPESGILLTNNHSQVFNNDEFGLIYTDIAGKSGTYLPKVFLKNEPWWSLKKTLIKKSQGTTEGNFFAYKCIILESTIISVAFNTEYRQFLCNIFLQNFIYQFYSKFPIYAVSKSNKIILNSSKIYENLFVMNAVLDIHQKLKKNTPPKLIKNIMKHIQIYIQMQKQNSLNYTQLAWLLIVMNKVNDASKSDHDSEIHYICNYLNENLSNMDRMVELPNSLMAIELSCMKSKEFNLNRNKYGTYIYESELINKNKINNESNEKQINNDLNWINESNKSIKHIQLLANKLTQSMHYSDIFVYFNSLSIILKYLQKINIYDEWFKIFHKLHQNYDRNYGLYKSKNGEKIIQNTCMVYMSLFD